MEPQILIENFLNQVRKLRSQTLALHGTYILLTYIAGSYLLACLLVLEYQPAVEWSWSVIGIFWGGLIYTGF